MNQILVTKNDNYCYYLKYNYFENEKEKKIKHKKNYLVILLSSSIICILILFYLIFSFISRINNKKKTSNLVKKYNILSRYPSSNSYDAIKLSDNIYIIGLIEIPSINISYPILSNCNEDLLKISVCKFSGPMPNQIGNMCIAGHNYKNSLMFSKLNKLNTNDSIFITDLNNTRLEYVIYQKSEIKQNNLEGIKNTSSTEITLITCNSIDNSERIMIKAKVKE